MTPFRLILLIAVVFQLGACASKKPKDDSGLSASDQAKISNEPMNFMAEGSDSQKIAGLSTIHFGFDTAVVPTSETKFVQENAQWIKSHPNIKMQIEGHCDQRGSTEYNLALGDRRAHSIYNALVEYGVDKGQLTTISFGEERPLMQGDSEESYAKNRRVNFVPLNAPQPHLSSN